ncbi:MAG: hypothetical protein KBC64_03230 [Simkaniaceae bacterium]|nr:hypothetical protein [Simkaniaceae bacterium]
MGRRYRPLTMIELMVCLCILVMIGGFTAIQGGKFLKNHLFRMSVERVKSEVRMIKLLASSLDADVTVIFQYDGRNLSLKVETDEKLPYPFKSFSIEADECSFDQKDLEEVRAVYSRSRQAVHEVKITHGTDHYEFSI